MYINRIPRNAGLTHGNDRYTVLLLHCDGADTSTTFTDSSLGGSTHTMTAVGTAQIDTDYSKFGGASYLNLYTNGYVSTPDSTDWDLTGDFAIDCWMRLKTFPGSGTQRGIMAQWPDSTHAWFLALKNNAGTYQLVWQDYNGGSNILMTRDISVSLSTWYHIEIDRHGSDWYMFLDGSQLSTSMSDATAVTNYTSALYVGSIGVGSYFDGWLDEVRLSNGKARHTSSFTPSTEAYY
jgi:Concanavalin A-like lectin/glucanases superfamily